MSNAMLARVTPGQTQNTYLKAKGCTVFDSLKVKSPEAFTANVSTPAVSTDIKQSMDDET